MGPSGRHDGDANFRVGWSVRFPAPRSPRKAMPPAKCRRLDPPLSRNLRDSGLVSLTPSVRHALLRVTAFQRSLCPARSLLPERFRGPVAPSATGTRPLSPAPGGWDGGTLPESRSRGKEGVCLWAGYGFGSGGFGLWFSHEFSVEASCRDDRGRVPRLGCSWAWPLAVGRWGTCRDGARQPDSWRASIRTRASDR